MSVAETPTHGASPALPLPSPAPSPSVALPELTHEEIRRYSRHLLLDDVGVVGQRRLKAARVLCIGSGGLGSPALMYLAAAGVGTLGVVDNDVVDESNLQRQIVHSTRALGLSKVESAAARIAEINPLVNFCKHSLRLTRENALEIIRQYDVVVDGSDNFPTRYLVNDACVLLGKPLVYGAIQKFEGQVSVFNYGGGPNYRDLFPEPPPPGEVPSCAEGGVLGILPGVVGCMQATEAVKICLCRAEGTLSGRLLLYDALAMRFHEIRLKPRPDTPPITQLVDYEGFCSGGACAKAEADPEGFDRVSVSECSRRMRQEGWAPYVLDVRTRAEAAIVSFAFVDRLQPHRQVAAIASELPADRDVLVHCKGGVRSAAACHTLAKLGILRLYSLDGGIVGWAKQIDPSMPTY